ncbi:hypothetical protein ACQ4PT_034595 [Festuca glaucescens]
MSQKKSRGGASAGDDADELSRSPLQAVLLADSFTLKFRPITLERPKVLLPLVNVPMIDYTLSWLETSGVEEVFVFCCAHAQQVKEHLEDAGWTGKPAAREMAVKTVESHDAISAGDALRVMYGRGVQTRLGNDEIVMAIAPETKELRYYEDRADGSHLCVTIDKDILASNPTLQLHNNMEDCYIDICSPEVLSLFTDNFDYQHLRRHFVKGLLVDDIKVGKNVVVPAYSKVSLLEKPSNEDSDEELEYADTNSGVTDSPPFSSMRSNADHPTVESEDEDLGASETGTSGVLGYIWASGDTGTQEEWRQSIAPIPKEKLQELQHAIAVDDVDGSEEDLNNRLREADHDNDSEISVVEDDDYTKFEKEMEILLKFEEMCQDITNEFSSLFSKILPYLYDKELVSEDAILRWAEEKENADESDKVFVNQSDAFIQWLKEAEEEEDEDEEE